MLDYDNMVKALRLSWLKEIVNPDYFGFWKSYLDHFWWTKGVIFNSVQLWYQPNNNLSNFLSRTIGLVVKTKRRILKDPEGIHRYILWNNKEIRIDGKSVFHKHFFDNNIIIFIHNSTPLWDDKYWVFQCCQGCRTEELQLLSMDKSTAISSTKTACLWAQLWE